MISTVNNSSSGGAISLSTEEITSPVVTHNKPLAGHKDDIRIFPDRVEKKVDETEYREYTLISNDPELQEITAPFLGLTSDGRMQLGRIDKGIDKQYLFAIDVKLGLNATNLVETLFLQKSDNKVDAEKKANEKFDKQTKKSVERGSIHNGFAVDGMVVMGEEIDTKKMNKDEGWQMIQQKLQAIPDAGIREQIMNKLGQDIDKVMTVLQIKAQDNDNPVAYCGSSLYIAIDVKDPTKAQAKLIDLGHPLRPSLVTEGANVLVSQQQMHSALQEQYQGVRHGLENLKRVLQGGGTEHWQGELPQSVRPRDVPTQ